ncbi:MAG: hypothetical protein ACPGWR_08050 [Ardenticatenaceae bacterium]
MRELGATWKDWAWSHKGLGLVTPRVSAVNPYGELMKSSQK